MSDGSSTALVALVTCSSAEESRTVARAVLEAKAAACVNILGEIESHYWWQDKLESSPEHLLVIKTTESRADELEEIVKQSHSYDTPEIIFLPVTRGEARYLAWLRGAVVGLVTMLLVVLPAAADTFQELKKQLGHRDPEKRAEAADGLTALGGNKVAELFREMLVSSNPERRQLAAVGLLQISDINEDLEAVRRLLDDDVGMVRWSAALALGETGRIECLPWLEQVAAEDSAASVRETAAEAVAKIKALIPWQRSLPDALAGARQRGQPVLVYFSLPRSPYCEKFETGVLRHPDVVDGVQGFVPVWINAARERAVADEYDVRGTPTVIFLDARGNEMRRIGGLVDVTGLLAQLDEVRRNPMTFREARRIASRQPGNVAANWRVAEAYLGDGREDLAEPYLRNIIKYDEANHHGRTDNAMFALGFVLGRQGKYSQAVYCLEALLERWPQYKDRDKALYCLGLSQLANGEQEVGNQTLADLQAEFPDSKTARAARRAIEKLGDKP